MKFQEYLNEGLISSWLSKQKMNVIESLKKAYQEIVETKDAGKLLLKAVEGKKLTSKEKSEIKNQSLDVLKGLGLGTLFVLPGGGLLVTMLVMIGKKYNINITPSAFRPKK